MMTMVMMIRSEAVRPHAGLKMSKHKAITGGWGVWGGGGEVMRERKN